MIRAIRGATTVSNNISEEILEKTSSLASEMIKQNAIKAEDVASVLVSVTADLNATFPAKAIRNLDGWTFVPVMCMQEIDVPGSLAQCIRIMMTVNTTIEQDKLNHIYHHEAKKLRPDLSND
ncbi:chorismate mutase AroH [Paraliobacillus ryukyuensis]|uniref:chorismate mutase n=1 Tax=Paraliobacillus ryukyuensis TaxID=200904 RepID=A0A366EGL6_9BACI|nr:chorismate mutase [Paraliobacillus ryukyuensis]RBP01537.1 chorismate mutase [Paraliobacillus ryukyuensis]